MRVTSRKLTSRSWLNQRRSRQLRDRRRKEEQRITELERRLTMLERFVRTIKDPNEIIPQLTR